MGKGDYKKTIPGWAHDSAEANRAFRRANKKLANSYEMGCTIMFKAGDQVKLKDGTILDIVNDQGNTKFEGMTKSYEPKKFEESDIDCYKSADINENEIGGDHITHWRFYTGPGYEYATRLNIANYAKFSIPEFEDIPLESIIAKHIYWGSEGYGYKGFYNGDEYILFTSIEKLPDGLKEDAIKNVK